MEKESPIKEAFKKIKRDIFTLQSQIHSLTREIHELKRTLRQTDNQTDTKTQPQNTQTQPEIRQTDRQTDESKPVPERLKTKNLPISTGNDGVQTDRQTIRQTDRQTQEVRLNRGETDKITDIEKVSEILNSLDTITKDLRQKFKKITPQEMLIFSTIYQLQEKGINSSYSLLSQKTGLSESVIRDYVQKLIKKGIPLDKSKEANKKVILSIPQDLQKIASLSTIIALREL